MSFENVVEVRVRPFFLSSLYYPESALTVYLMVIICLDKKIGSLRNEDDDGYEDFNDLKIRDRVIHITTKLFHVVSR